MNNVAAVQELAERNEAMWEQVTSRGRETGKMLQGIEIHAQSSKAIF